MNYQTTSFKWMGAIVAGVFAGLLSVSGWANPPVTGAAFTTTNTTVDGTGHCKNGNEAVNCNIYDGKQYVWLTGGPLAASIGDGTYFFAVLVPGGQPTPNDAASVPDTGGATAKNLSDDFDAWTNRTFTVTGGAITAYVGTHDKDLANNKIRLMPYSDTTNPGGVYILAICSVLNYPADASKCKYDAFKIQESGSGDLPDALPLTVTKDADGSYDNTYAWTISKGVDNTIVKQVGGLATFNYTVTVTHDGGTISNVAVSGTITVTNPNVDEFNNTVPVDINGVTDQLSDGTVCTVTNGGAQTLTQFKTDFAYTCSLSGLPSGPLSNTVTVDWSYQILVNATELLADTATFSFENIAFAANAGDECIAVSDSAVGSLGSACVGDANPKTFTYSRNISVPQFGCQSYDNTATFTTNDTGATGSASQTVTVCGPVKTGALTMGFWQNKNGQAIITGQAATGVCSSATWLRQYAPFQDLSATATCAQVGTYVTNVIKAANASGAAMNAMLKGQDLATSLDVYFSDPALGGNKIAAPAPIGGVAIDLTKVCKNIAGGCTIYENTSAAFGGAASLTVSQLLGYAASQSNSGGSAWYGQVKAMQELAKDTFDAINNQVAFAP